MGHADKWLELERVLSGATDKSHVILLGGHPDPDSIGSALAHKRVCERLGVSATIAHVLPISRAENRAMVKLLNVPMVKVTDSDELLNYGYLSLVDASQSEQTIRVPESLQLLTVVDHHRPASIPKAPFVDIRHDVGATATIYAEYSERGLVPFGANGNDDSVVATAMFFGIQTDTDDFAFATPNDFRAAAYLKQFSDAETLSRVGRRTLTAEAMEAVGYALRDLEVVAISRSPAWAASPPSIATRFRWPPTTSCAARTSTRSWFTASSKIASTAACGLGARRSTRPPSCRTPSATTARADLMAAVAPIWAASGCRSACSRKPKTKRRFGRWSKTSCASAWRASCQISTRTTNAKATDLRPRG